MAMIDFDKAKESLAAFRDELKEIKCHKSAGTVQRCIDRLMEIECEENAAPMTAEKVAKVEPFFRGGQIGRDVWHCGSCDVVIDKHDRYCRGCGRKLIG